ncbi:unnamed protein product, partial [Mesorhabditis spiculigera]
MKEAQIRRPDIARSSQDDIPELLRLRQLIATHEAELRKLSAELATERARPKHGLADIAALGSLLKEKDDTIAKLVEDNRKLNLKIEVDAKEQQDKIDELEAELERYKVLTDALNQELDKRTEYDLQNEKKEMEAAEEEGKEAPIPSALEATLKSLDMMMQTANYGDEDQEEQRNVTADLSRQFLSGKATVVDVNPKTTNGTSTTREDDHQSILTILMNSINGSPPLPSSPLMTSGTSFDLLRDDDDKCDVSNLSNHTYETPRHPSEVKAINELTALIASNTRKLGSRALNTAEVARQCKRLMAGYNIGQRLFAKFVMNQSQGSLSELLSKPRPWCKLTDKGREAFRRIYSWISDVAAVQLLCQISPRRILSDELRMDHPKPEDLWETSNPLEQITTVPTPSPAPKPPKVETNGDSKPRPNPNRGSTSRWRHDDIPKEKIMSIFQNELAKLREQENNIERAINSRTYPSSLQRLEDITYGGVTVQGLPSKHAIQVMNNRVKSGLQTITQEQFEAFGIINTEEVVRQVKDFLMVNTISQRQFGESVLGLSQGSVSDLLARPKAWYMLTQKGREPYIRMKLFMDEVAVEAAKDQDSDKDKDDDEGSKPVIREIHPERSSSEETIESDWNGERGSSEATATADILPGEEVAVMFLPIQTEKEEDYEDMKMGSLIGSKRFSEDDDGTDSTPRKMQRTVITEQQREALRYVFAQEQHPAARTIEMLANKLGLSTRTVSNWFHNYRTRQKASMKEGKVPQTPQPTMDLPGNWKKDLTDLLMTKPAPVIRDNNKKPASENFLGSLLEKAVEEMRKNAAQSISLDD